MTPTQSNFKRHQTRTVRVSLTAPMLQFKHMWKDWVSVIIAGNKEDRGAGLMDHAFSS